ncbi:unnamed protein product [Cochlearia groenlandica]
MRFYTSHHAYISIHIVTFILLLLLISQWSHTNANTNIASQLSTTKTKSKTCPFPTLLISKACKGTAAFSSLEEACIKSLTSNQRTNSAKSASELAKAALNIATEKTMVLIGSPKKPCFKSCAENYRDSVVQGLKKAALSMDKGDVEETDDELSRARDAADYCNMILNVDPDDTRSPVFKANVDVYNHITFVMSVADML